MDCYIKKVAFRKLGFSKLEFYKRSLEAKRLLHKGCEAYLAHVIDTSTPKVTLESVSIVREFLDVFL